MEEFVTMQLHSEFAKRMEEENDRQNARLKILEDNVTEIQDLTRAIDKLATNMEHMATEQERQGRRLETLEHRDGEKWRRMWGYIIPPIVTLIVGVLATALAYWIGV